MTSRFLAICCLVLAGCAGSGRVNYTSPQDAYDRGMAAFNEGKYMRAAQYFQGVFDFGRTHDWADDARLQLARSYRMNRDFILAASEYSSFSSMYRGDERVPVAEFERAMTFYERSPAIELDQTSTRRGIDVFNLYIQRFPEHDSVSVAMRRVGELREKLADKQFHAAGLYERRGLYEAAALTYELMFDKYPDTPLADDALLGAIRCYIEFSARSIQQRQAERLETAIGHYERLVQIFPESDLIEEASELRSEADRRLDRLVASDTSP